MDFTHLTTHQALAKVYHELTDRLVIFTGQTDKFVHMNAGLLIWLLVSLACSGARRWWWGLAAIVAIESINEVFDRLSTGGWNWPDTRGDMIATWAWPLVLTVTFALDGWRRGRRG